MKNTNFIYLGCTITLTHLAPFVRDSYNGYLKKYKDAGLDEELSEKLATIDLKKEVKDSVQTFNYQINRNGRILLARESSNIFQCRE